MQLEKPEQHTEINQIKQQLDEINEHRSNGARIRAKVQWIEEGERGTKFFHGLEKSRASNKQWTSIRNTNGNNMHE